jgi:exodeoxyribonuclease III
MRIVTWNVNSIRTRLPRLLGVLQRHQPDAVCIQELKVAEDEFPSLELKAAGYEAALVGQKSYNGVAILSRAKLTRVESSFSDDVADEQARFLAAELAGIRVLCVYVPNGGEVGSDKWEYKLGWLARLRSYLDRNEDRKRPLAVCGDFNVAPDDADVKNPARWKDTVLCHPDGRAALKRVIEWGLVDAFRRVHPDGGIYSWWDYRMLGFPKNDGLRIDGVYVTLPLAERLKDARIDREERKGKQPSDHAPVIVDFD